MKSTRKEVERYQLETFRDVCTEFPAGEIIDSEEPDFLIKINDGVLGVELTELYHESSRSSRPMQAIEKLTDSIVEEACSIHRTAGGPVRLYVLTLSCYRKDWERRNAPRSLVSWPPSF